MKANELMIGDWVHIKRHQNIRLSAISEFENTVSYFDGESGCGLELSENNIEPIPLTTEILEKNGYVKDEDIRGYVSFCHRITFHYEDVFKNTGNSWYVHVDNNCFNSIGSIEVTYVHQFQQFLRLCGYSEMAEEFKV